MNERLRILREELDMSRATFGKKIGVSGDTINNLERGRSEFKDNMVKLICKTFHVSERWLRDGTGEMFEHMSDADVNEICDKYDLTDGDVAFVRAFVRMEEDERAAVLKFIADAAEQIQQEKEDAVKAEIDAKVDAYRRQLEIEASTRERSSGDGEDEKRA